MCVAKLYNLHIGQGVGLSTYLNRNLLFTLSRTHPWLVGLIDWLYSHHFMVSYCYLQPLD